MGISLFLSPLPLVASLSQVHRTPSASLQISPVGSPSHDHQSHRPPYSPDLFAVSCGWSPGKAVRSFGGSCRHVRARSMVPSPAA